MNGALVSTALLLFGVAASQHAYAVVLISDSFNRTTGVVGDDTVIPPIDGVSDWGSFDNAEGGTVAPIPYKLTVNNNPGNEEITDGANGIINHDPLFIDYNLAADPNVQAADGVRIRVDVNPNDIGGAGDFGRDWLAIGFADTNNNVDSIQNDTFVTGTNVDARIGIGVRNSGSAITRRAIATGTGGSTLERFRTGIPHEINEPIFDQPTYDAYVAHWDAENTPPVTPEVTTEFTSDVWYTVEFNIFKDGSSQHLFEDDAQMRFQVYIGRRGETLNRLDFNVSTPPSKTRSSGATIRRRRQPAIRKTPRQAKATPTLCSARTVPAAQVTALTISSSKPSRRQHLTRPTSTIAAPWIWQISKSGGALTVRRPRAMPMPTM